MTEETVILLTLTFVMLVGSYLAGSIPLVMRLSEEKLKTITILGAGLLVGTALTVIIPEGINSLYMKDNNELVQQTLQQQQQISQLDAATHSSYLPLQQQQQQHATHNHARTIGLSLVLGFVFMMLVDHVSQTAENITATLGLVVHAAADGVALGAAATTSHQDVEIIVFLAIMLHKAPAAFGLVSFLLHERIDRQEIRKHLAIFSVSAPLFTLLTYFGIGQEQKETLNSVNATGIAMLFSAGTFLYVATVHVLPELTNTNHHQHHNHHHNSTTKRNAEHEYRILMNEGMATESNEIPTTSANALKIAAANEVDIISPRNSRNNNGLRFSQLIIMITGALMPLIITFGHSH